MKVNLLCVGQGGAHAVVFSGSLAARCSGTASWRGVCEEPGLRGAGGWTRTHNLLRLNMESGLDPPAAATAAAAALRPLLGAGAPPAGTAGNSKRSKWANKSSS